MKIIFISSWLIYNNMIGKTELFYRHKYERMKAELSVNDNWLEMLMLRFHPLHNDYLLQFAFVSRYHQKVRV